MGINCLEKCEKYIKGEEKKEFDFTTQNDQRINETENNNRDILYNNNINDNDIKYNNEEKEENKENNKENEVKSEENDEKINQNFQNEENKNNTKFEGKSGEYIIDNKINLKQTKINDNNLIDIY